MAISKVTYKLNLKKLGVDKNSLSDVQDAVGNYIKEQILEDCSDQISSVNGMAWKKLKPKYAKIKSQTSSSNVANLELYGDMLDSLEFKNTSNGIEIGIFDYDQAQKADNHCKFSSASKNTPLPKRQFIPKSNQSFRSDIMKNIEEIINENIKPE